MRCDKRRQIPAVSKVLDAIGHSDLPRRFVVEIVRRELSRFVAALALRNRSHRGSYPPLARCFSRQQLQPVINGTGIVIHTNFGRGPLPTEAMRALNEIGTAYSNLEYDIAKGERGGRGAYLESGFALLCEAEAATVVNNCAAALVLIVHHFTRKIDKLQPPGAPQVVISRGELVQIGGGFRISEILEASGATIARGRRSTNKTTIDDYAQAVGSKTAMILKVHRSNFFMRGFVESPSSDEIRALAKKHRIPFVEDLGSGAMIGD